MRQTKTQTTNFDYCLDLEQFVDDPSCVLGPSVIINEVTWMGTEISFSDEWIELRNTTGADIDLTGWTLNAQDGTPSVNLSGTILANGYFLLERTDDNSVPGILADQIYSGGLGNNPNGEFLELKNNENNLIDSVDGSSGWLAGNNTTKQTMSLCSDVWQDSSQAGGTPRAANVCEGTSLPPEAGGILIYKYADLDGDIRSEEHTSELQSH